MTLMEAWKDSLQLCKPQAMKLIFLVTLNAMRQAVRALIAPWFLVPIVLLIVASALSGSMIPAFMTYGFVVAALLLAVRPSVQIKNWDYFRRYFWLLFCFAVELVLWGAVITTMLIVWEFLLVPFGHTHSFLADGKLVVFGAASYIATFPSYVVGIIAYGANILCLLYYAAFFYLDKVGSVYTSCKKALILVSYNLPMVLIYTGIAWAIKICLQLVATYAIVFFMANVVTWKTAYAFFFAPADLVLYLFFVALISNIYTKRVHDQYALYQ